MGKVIHILLFINVSIDVVYVQTTKNLTAAAIVKTIASPGTVIAWRPLTDDAGSFRYYYDRLVRRIPLAERLAKCPWRIGHLHWQKSAYSSSWCDSAKAGDYWQIRNIDGNIWLETRNQMVL